MWRSGESGLFLVRSAYDHLASLIRGPHNDLYRCLWKIKVLPNVLVMAWRVLLDRIPTRLALSRRGVTMNTPICAMCQAKEESSQLLFLECVNAQRVWSMCFRWIDILFVQHNDLKCHFENFICNRLLTKL